MHTILDARWAPKDPTGHAELEEEDEETLMARMMGFGSFSSTQGVHVNDATANASGVRLMTKRSARQYMNRRGGFNRPLPAERTGERVRRD